MDSTRNVIFLFFFHENLFISHKGNSLQQQSNAIYHLCLQRTGSTICCLREQILRIFWCSQLSYSWNIWGGVCVCGCKKLEPYPSHEDIKEAFDSPYHLHWSLQVHALKAHWFLIYVCVSGGGLAPSAKQLWLSLSIVWVTKTDHKKNGEMGKKNK